MAALEPLLAKVGALAVAEPVAEEEAGKGVVLVAGTGGTVVVGIGWSALVGAAEEAGEGLPEVGAGSRQVTGVELEARLGLRTKAGGASAGGVGLEGREAGLTSHLDLFLEPPFFSSSWSSLFLFIPAACCCVSSFLPSFAASSSSSFLIASIMGVGRGSLLTGM